MERSWEVARERDIPLSFFTIIIVLSCLFHYLLFFTLFNLLSAANLFQLRQYKLNCGRERERKSERGSLNDRRKRIEHPPIILCFTKWLLTKNANEEWRGESPLLSTEAHKYEITRTLTNTLTCWDRWQVPPTLLKYWESYEEVQSFVMIRVSSVACSQYTAVRPNTYVICDFGNIIYTTVQKFGVVRFLKESLILTKAAFI